MKTIIAITFAAFLFAACGSGEGTVETANDSTSIDSTVVDSVKVTADSTK